MLVRLSVDSPLPAGLLADVLSQLHDIVPLPVCAARRRLAAALPARLRATGVVASKARKPNT